MIFVLDHYTEGSVIISIIQDPETILSLEPEELVGVVLEFLNSEHSRNNDLNRTHFGLPHIVQGYRKKKKEEIHMALMEAWIARAAIHLLGIVETRT